MPRANQLCRAVMPDGTKCQADTGSPWAGYCEAHTEARRQAQAEGRRAGWERARANDNPPPRVGRKKETR